MIVKGIADGCEQAGCALIGGETAEMPGMYEIEEYDVAGFTVGAVEKSRLITGEAISSGDVVIGLASSGIHSNGYSLVRKVLLEDAGMDLHDFVPEFGCELGEELLKPTKIYVQSILSTLEKFEVKGLAHITGGGFIENIPRILPENCGVEIELGTWTIPPVFSYLEEKGNLVQEEMFNIFNMGIGMTAVVKEADAPAVIAHLQSCGEQASVIGTIVEGEGVSFKR